jgi:hypothetical protein
MAEKKKKDSVLDKAKSLYRAGRKKFKEMTSAPKSKGDKGTINKEEMKQMKDVEAKNVSKNPKLQKQMKNVRVAASTPKNNVYGA